MKNSVKMPEEIYLRGRYIGKMQDSGHDDEGCTRYVRSDLVQINNISEGVMPCTALEEFDRFCRFIDGLNMGGFVENDFMSKRVQEQIRAKLKSSPEIFTVENVPDNECSKLAYILADCMTNFDTATISGGLFAAHQAMQIISEKYPDGIIVKKVLK